MKQLTAEDILAYNDQKAQEKQMGQTEQGPDGAPIYTNPDPATFPPMIEVHDYDNHDVHIKTHNNYRKSTEFLSLPEEVKAEFNRHVRLHQAYVSMVAQQQMQEQMAQAMGGQPPQSGAPGADPNAGGGADPGADPMAQMAQEGGM